MNQARNFDRKMASAGDVQKMIFVGLIWGATNAIMRRGALIWDQKLRSPKRTNSKSSSLSQKTLAVLKDWIDLILTWQYSIPFAVNLSASAAFFAILGDCPISVAVPVTNATTFAATAVTGLILGERMRVGSAAVGTLLIVLGVWICIS